MIGLLLTIALAQAPPPRVVVVTGVGGEPVPGPAVRTDDHGASPDRGLMAESEASATARSDEADVTDRYRPQAPDTDEATDRYLMQRLRSLPPWKKAEMLSAACRAADELAMAGLRQRYPGAGLEELRKRFAAIVLGRDASIALFGWDPEIEGW